MRISRRDRLKLFTRVVPYWTFRNLVFRAFYPRIGRFLRYAAEQLNATYYLINEAGGIGHFLPNYERILKIGMRGYIEELEKGGTDFHRSAIIACEGIVAFAGKLAAEAARLAETELDAERRAELKEIERICAKVPFEPAERSTRRSSLSGCPTWASALRASIRPFHSGGWTSTSIPITATTSKREEPPRARARVAPLFFGQGDGTRLSSLRAHQ